jgi:hypothetical protein
VLSDDGNELYEKLKLEWKKISDEMHALFKEE